MSPHALHTSLLRPAVIHILRAAGFHATKPSVVDTLTDICARYMLLIASKTAASTYDRTVTELGDVPEGSDVHDEMTNLEMTPTITDVRTGLTSAAFFTQGLSTSEEAWAEAMRKPLASFPAGAREKERRRRDLEDTQDVREFVDWAMGPAAKEIRRVAGLLPDEAPNPPAPANVLAPPVASSEGAQHKVNYLEALKKKQSKSGDNSRYQGTALGNNQYEHKPVRIEGGPASLGEWQLSLKRKREEQTR